MYRIIIQRSVARHMLFVEGGGAEDLVVIRHVPVHPADRADWGPGVLVVGTPGVSPPPVVNDPPAPIHPGAVIGFMGDSTPLGPLLAQFCVIKT